MQGLTLKYLRGHPSLVALHGFFGLGVLLAGGYLIRLATKSPEVCWDRKKPYPWERLPATHQYKFYATRDYAKEVNSRPEY